MPFTNTSDQRVYVPDLGVWLDPGQTHDPTPKPAKGTKAAPANVKQED